MKKGILSDPLICEDFLRINRELKLNIIKEIVKCSSAVSIDFLATTVKESPEVLEDWILFGISDGSIRVRIDDIEKVLYSVESDCVSTTISKTLEYMKRSYDNSVIKLISLSSSSMYNDSQMILEKMKTYEIELDSMRGMLRQGGLRDEEDPMENIESY